MLGQEGQAHLRLVIVPFLARAMPRLVIDRRERNLLHLIPDAECETLEVGDVLCQNEGGPGWVAERKTTTDLARSLCDGRWDDQRDRLLNSGRRAIFIIEGGFKDVDFPREPWLGACVNVAANDGALLFRTWGISETVPLIEQLAKTVDIPSTTPINTLGVSKRRKYNTAENIWIRQLTCIPTVSERVARALLTHFGPMAELQSALRVPSCFRLCT